MTHYCSSLKYQNDINLITTAELTSQSVSLVSILKRLIMDVLCNINVH